MIDHLSSAAPKNRRDGANQATSLPFQCVSTRIVSATADALFRHLDDHKRLASHMSQSSWMMAGSMMDIELDAAKGQAEGSHIRLRGRVAGISISVDEVVTEHEPPLRKVWETMGVPKLLVIGHYKMGFEITPQGTSSLLHVFINYDLPEASLPRLLGHLLGGFYARWCTESMAKDAAAYFMPSAVQKPRNKAV